ncbi:MAG: EAL domain-containing protein [Spirochaetales bacterium]|nr:EAL domain-containing protein [Spirochaetales bacterium]
MSLYENSNLVNELKKLRNEISQNQAKISQLNEVIEEHKHYLTINPKTGLPNHKMFIKDLEKFITLSHQRSSGFALIFIDLNKSLTNIEYSLDSFWSDAILSKISFEIKEVLDDYYAELVMDDSSFAEPDKRYRIYHSERYEELMVIMPYISSIDICKVAAKHIYLKISEPKRLEFNNDILHLESFLALTMYPLHGNYKEELLSNTDIALRFGISKNLPIVLYSESLGHRMREKKSLEKDLRNILDGNDSKSVNEQFILHYQPLVDNQGFILGAEAVLRWQHKEKGLLYPLKFMDMAEKNGHIVPIGYIVIEKSCAILRQWLDQKLITEDFYLSVNLSPKQFKQNELVPKISYLLRKYKIPSQFLRIEITENAYFDNVFIAAEKIRELFDLGVKIMMDDCGAPGNSIYNLRKLPIDIIEHGMIDYIKLDKSLIESIHRFKDRLFFKHSIEMAWKLDIGVVVEGLETIEQEMILREMEEEFVNEGQKIEVIRQGFLFSRPQPHDDFIKLLKQVNLVPPGLKNFIHELP